MGRGVWIILLRQGFFKQKLKPVGSLFRAMIYLGRHSRGFCFQAGLPDWSRMIMSATSGVSDVGLILHGSATSQRVYQ